MIKLEYNLEDLDKPLTEIFVQNPEKWNYLINLKALLGSMFANLERLFKGCFGQEIDLDCTEEQYALFKRIFPAIAKSIERCGGREGMEMLCKKLSAIRNECMHARSKLYESTIRIDRDFIDALPNHSNWRYSDEDDKLTLAGLLAILMCMANKEMVGSMAASGLSDLVNQIGLFPGYDSVYGKALSEILEKQLGTDLEAEIRQVKGDTPLTALWGEYLPKVKVSDTDFEYASSESVEDSLHYVRGRIAKEAGRLTLTIYKGSFYHVYFPEEYKLFIDDEPYFIEMANKVPPFMLVPFLRRAGIKQLYRGVLTEKQEELCGKLNKAKFYADKNVNILLLGNSVSDQRSMSQSATPQALYCLLNLEHNLYWNHEDEIESEKRYSTLADSLKAIGIEQSLIDEAVALRNFFAHGSILGDYVGRALSTYRQFELKDVIRVFKDLVLALEPRDIRSHNRLMGDVAQRLAEQLADMKYKDYAQKWDQIIYRHRPWMEQMIKPMMRIDNSYLTKEMEEELGWFFYDKRFSRFTVFEVQIDPSTKLVCNRQVAGTDRLLIILMKRNVDLMEVFGKLGKDGFEKTDEWRNPLVRYKKFRLR